MRGYQIGFAVLAAGILTVSAAGPGAARPYHHVHHGSVCHRLTPDRVEALFQRWNHSLSETAEVVVKENYAQPSTLLPTVENGPYVSPQAQMGYFEEFLKNKPVGTVIKRMIFTDCDTAVDAGLYDFEYKASGKIVHARFTFTYSYSGGRWLITSHHSSKLPEPGE